MIRLLPLLSLSLALTAAAEPGAWRIEAVPGVAPGPVTLARVSLDTPDGPAAGLLATVDLTDPRVEVVVTGPPADPPPPPAEVPLETVAAFAEGRDLDLAVNANYFGVCAGSSDADVLGLCVSDGVVVSPARSFNGVPDPVLVFAEGGEASIDADALTAFDAVAGIGASDTDPDHGGPLVLDGVSRGVDARVEPLFRHPRTAAGLDAAGRTLTLVVIDGRQPGHSVGVTLPELADLLLARGVDDAINLDGGGSSVMVLGPALATEGLTGSRPFEDRPVAASLGIRVHPPAGAAP